jgi:hypothetical protein
MPKTEPKIVDCSYPGCDGKVDLAGDETCCPKCGTDMGAIAKKYQHEQALKNYAEREEKKKQPEKKEKKGYTF